MKPLHTSSTSAISLRTKLQATRSDNGGEYINAAVAKFKSGKGIDPQPSFPYMPHSNGSAENLNFKLLAKTTAMLLTAKLDSNMRSEAIKTVAYVRNMSPHSATPGNQTPYGMFNEAALFPGMKLQHPLPSSYP
jgi:transposase InsO family protein